MVENDTQEMEGVNKEHDILRMITIISAIVFILWSLIPCVRIRTKTFNACKNPGCVRCQCYRHIQSRANIRVAWVARHVQTMFPDQSLKRVCDSICHPQKYIQTHLQAPTLLMVPNLPSREVVTDAHPLHQHFEVAALVGTILSELNQVPLDVWTRNDTPTGSWEVLWLLNQGKWSQEMSMRCPRLWNLVRTMPNLLDNCLLGNAMVSKIHPGTTIEPHCGPTNVRHRLQYTLVAAPDSTLSFLRVGQDTQVSWGQPGSYFVFDDSYVHSVRYNHPSTDRMVLIVDLWHPDLSQAERTLVQHMYPPFQSTKITTKKEA